MGYRPLHTWDWEPMTITLQALSLVEKPEPVQVRFTLRLRDQRSKWMQDECKVCIDSYMASNGSCFMATWTIFKNCLLKVDLHKTMRPWHSKHSQLLIDSILSCVRTHMNRNSLKWHLVENPITYDFTLHLRVRNHTLHDFWRCLGTTFGHLLLGSHNFMVTALGSCVKCLYV